MLDRPPSQRAGPLHGCKLRIEVALGIINFFKIGVVRNCLDSFLQGDYLIITGHYDNGTELKALGKMHGAD